MTQKKTNNFNQPYAVYAHKLEKFLKYNNWDKDTCVLLGEIASVSMKKHTSLYDEIRVAIGALHMCDAYADYLITGCKATVACALKY